MKTKFRHRVIAMTLAMMMTAAPAEEFQIAEATQVAEAAPTSMIADKDVPMAGIEENSYWALLNLIMTILMAVILLIQAIVAIFAKKSEDEDEDEEIAEAVNA